MVRAWPLALLALGLLACANSKSGRDFSADLIPRIEIGHTTQAEVRQIFGQPIGMAAIGSGGTEWRYYFEETDTQSTRTLSKLGCWITRVLGGRCIGTPLDVELEQHMWHELIVYFNAGGIVEDYIYEKRDEPSARVF